jgi:hypothetical protein
MGKDLATPENIKTPIEGMYSFFGTFSIYGSYSFLARLL